LSPETSGETSVITVDGAAEATAGRLKPPAAAVRARLER
jgi:hypothetical protein